MTEPVESPRVSCLSVMLSGIVAGSVIVLARGRPWDREPLPWPATAVAVVAAIVVFRVERRLQGFFWGLIAAGLMALHPALRPPPSGDWSGILAETAVLSVLALTSIGWQLAFLSRFAWRIWPLVSLGLAIAIALAWAGEARAGVFAAVLAGGGLLAATLLVRGLRARRPAQVPALLNMGTAALVSVLSPTVGLFLYRLLDASVSADDRFWSPLLAAKETVEGNRSLSLEQLNRWCWPTVWVVAPLAAWALWRTVWVGWQKWQQAEAPDSWLLTYYALLLVPSLFFWPLREANAVPLTLSALVVLLVVFLDADLLKRCLRRLVLPPPEELRPSDKVPT